MAAGVSLSGLAKQVHYSKGHLSKVESDQKVPSVELARLCDAALDAGGGLVHLMQASRVKEGLGDEVVAADAGLEEMWHVGLGDDGGYFTPVSAPHLAVPRSGLGLVFDVQSRVDGAAALAPFLTRFDGARNLGQVAGPGVVLPLVIVETKTLRTLASHAPPDEQAALFLLAARFAEFAGWMAQEAGDDRIAWWLTIKAVEMADAAGDTSLRSYALVRRAEIALYQDDALSMIDLTVRAQRVERTPSRVKALAAQREAQGHALIGDHTSCFRALERSASWLSDAATAAHDPLVLGTSRVPDLVALMRGWCLHDLGRSAVAAEILDAAIARFPPEAHRARLRYQLRSALAYAAAGELERACELTHSLLGTAGILDSATSRHDLRSLLKVLRRWHSHPAVCTLLPALTALLHQKRNSAVMDMLEGL